jgi:hypothetical protein
MINKLFPCFILQHNSNGYPEGHGLVTIKMIPDEQGRFGFNVKVSTILKVNNLYLITTGFIVKYIYVRQEKKYLCFH